MKQTGLFITELETRRSTNVLFNNEEKRDFQATTLAIGEEGGDIYTTLAIGEEGGC